MHANIIYFFHLQVLEQNASSGYSAPEVTMSGQYSLKSDVYSFGVVMLELLTGRKPFDRWAFHIAVCDGVIYHV